MSACYQGLAPAGAEEIQQSYESFLRKSAVIAPGMHTGRAALTSLTYTADVAIA
jgi:hypothetical protein